MRTPLVAALVAGCLTTLVLASQEASRLPAGLADAAGRVSVVVLDRRGQPLAALKPEDFDVTVDGRAQPIDTAELVKGDAEAPRTYAILLDEFHVAAADSQAVRDAMLRFLERDVRPTDRLFIVKPLDPLTKLQPVADRETARRLVSGFEGRKGDFTARTAFEKNYMAQAPEAVAWARAQIITSALRAIGMTLGEPPAGRAAVLLVSDGFERMRSSREIPANLQTAIRILNRGDAGVYAFAPSAQLPPPGTAPDPAVAALLTLTSGTGGELSAGAATFDRGFDRLTRDFTGYYVLGYKALHGSDGRYHAVEVALAKPVATKQPGAVVRARGGYVAPMSAEMRAAANAPVSSIPVRVTRRSPLIQSWAGIVPAAPGRVRVMVTWEPAPPRPGAAVAKGRASSIVITAASPDGSVLFDAATGPVGGGPGEEAPDQAAFEAPVGMVRIDMKILDAKGVVIDTDARDISVPAPRKTGPTIYPPALVRTQSAREFRLALANPEAPGVPSREFRRTERLLIRIAATDAAGAPIRVTAVLMNRMRQPMRTLEALEGSFGSPTVTQFDLPLSSFAPGDYALQLSSIGDGTTASEYVSFKIIG